MIDFFKKPDELVARFKAKNPEAHFDYDEIKHDAHKRVFTIAKMMNLDLLKDMQSSLTKAFHNGVTFDEWKKDIIPHLKKSGWWGEIEVDDPKSGKPKKVFVGARRLKRIFDTNLRTSYAGAKKQSLDESSLEYYRYTAVLDSRTRPTHRAMHGIILPKDHPFWKNNFPPNGWGCRCTVRGYSKKQLERKGLKPFSGTLPNVSHDDFGYDMSVLDSAFKQKAKKVLNLIQNKDLETAIKEFDKKRDLYIWQKGLDNAIYELLIKKNLKSPIDSFQLGVLSNFLINKIAKILKINTKTKHIMGDKKGILHIRPERKGIYNQDLRIDEIRKIVKILSDENTPVSIDIDKKNIIFWFDDEKDAKKINKIVVDLNYNLKKFGVTNYMVTIGKALKADELGKSSYIKIR
ncbi:phage head morphogenesis protein [Campylobacter ureolyticus]|uniref:Phage head morphogenesis protein n=1 Tax=Campylobacter ureolyticus TaxID=827 RepID=A0A2I1N8H9_9BACT|nr:phage minor head protein [Campylobacter ureolyticus]PKZ28668.1 phage head morphogenesis protein [Campylobacter ureolyticus]